MEIIKETPDYVGCVLDDAISITVYCQEKKKFLRSIGAHRKWFVKNKWRLKYCSQKDLINKLQALRDNGFLFSYDEHGWGPADIFCDLREKKLVHGEVREIFWRGPNKIGTRIV